MVAAAVRDDFPLPFIVMFVAHHLRGTAGAFHSRVGQQYHASG
jgi:hypothetical protein